MTTLPEHVATIHEQIGARLRAARLQAVLTQDELAQALGVDRSTVAKWEIGQRSLTVENLIRAATILEIPPYQLLADSTGERLAARTLSEVIIEQQAAQMIARTLEQRPDAIPVIVAALKRWSQSGQEAEELPSENLSGSYAMRTIIHQLHDVDITVMTPLRALQLLDELQQLANQTGPMIEPTES